MSNQTVSIALTPAQFSAVRKLSLKYENVSVEKLANRLFAQVVRNYYKTDMKAQAAKAGENWDKAVKLGFDTKITREEYVGRAVKEAKAIWLELNSGSAIVE